MSRGQWEASGRRRGSGVRYERVGERGTERAGARFSHLSIAGNERIVKKNLLLVRYSFERLAKSFKGGGLQRGWGEKVTIQRPGAKPMFGF